VSGRASLAAGAAALVYLLVPGHPLSWLPGLPLGPLGLASALLVGLLLFAFWPLPARRAACPDAARETLLPRCQVGIGATPARGQRGAGATGVALGALVVAKLFLGWFAPQYGLPAWYYPNSRFQGEPERSTDFPRESATRRDREIEFGGDEFPVHFLNDSQRFNFYGPESERRRSLPFSVRWQGTLYAPRDDTYRVWLTASGPGSLTIDGKQVASVDADGRDTDAAALTLTRGSHDIRINYARRAPRSGDLRVEWEPDGRRQNFAIPYLLAAPIAPDAWERDRFVSAASRLVDGLFLTLLGGVTAALLVARAAQVRSARGGRWVLLERPALALFLALIFLHAALPELDRVDKMSLLGGGQDWLTHETLARDILLNGPLLTLGQPLGEGRPYYVQPFYPYALAAAHWLTGEGQFGPTVLQLFGLGVAGVLLYYLAERLFGPPAAIGTLALFLGLRTWQLDWVARKLLSENLYFVLVPAALLCLVSYVDQRRRRDLLLAGLFLGLATVTRNPTLLYLPLSGLLLYLALRRGDVPGGRAARAAALPVAIAIGILALVPLRNLVVAGQPALVAASGGVNLEKLHRPTPKVRMNEANHRWYAPYVQDIPTREVLEFIQQDPVGYAATYMPLALYALGYGAAIDESHIVVWPDLVLLNALYLLAILMLRSARSLRAAFLHAFVGTHFLTMVVFAPYDYDNRLVLPMYLPISVFAGAALATMAGLVRARLAEHQRPAGPVRFAEPPAG
jgi:Dolichyl-phosphate-mannose-protein mannosyltransferase/PA14 domain